MILILLFVFLSCTASLGFEILFSPPLTITAGSKATATWARELPFDAATFTLQLKAQSGADAAPTTIDSQAQTTGEVIFTFPTPGTFNVQGWRQDPDIDIGGSNILQVLAVKADQPPTSVTPSGSRKPIQATPTPTPPPSSPASTSVLSTSLNRSLPSSRQDITVNTPLALSTSFGSLPAGPTKVSETHSTTHSATHTTKIIVAVVIVIGLTLLAISLLIIFQIRRRRERIRESRTAEFYRKMIAQSHHSRLVSEGTISEDKDSISAESTQQPQTWMQSSSNDSRPKPASPNPFETSDSEIPDRAPRDSVDSGSIVFFSLPRRVPSVPSFAFPMHPLSSAFPSPNRTLASEAQPGTTVAKSAGSTTAKRTKPSKSWFKEKRVSWKEDLTQVVHAAL